MLSEELLDLLVANPNKAVVASFERPGQKVVLPDVPEGNWLRNGVFTFPGPVNLEGEECLVLWKDGGKVEAPTGTPHFIVTLG
jgi:hypothetical protein